MIKDIHFNFVGFHGSDGYCHLRIAQKSSTSKMVIVCSQYKNYYGTSPTNAVELIAEKFFNDVVDGKIKDVSLPIVPIYEKCHDNVTWLDQVLVRLNLEKYKPRPKKKLDIPKIFNKIIWIERYPAGTLFEDKKDVFSLVSMGDKKDPSWHGRPSEIFIKKETGFDFSDLFADPQLIDLKKIQKNFAEIDDKQIDISNHLNRRVIWTQDLLQMLPLKIKEEKFSTGRENYEDLWELQIQGLVEKIFAISFPAKDLFKNEFPVSKQLGIHQTGSEKKCDLVIFEPESNHPSIMIEIKRASKSVIGQSNKILQDIAKLLIYSKAFKCDSYLLICGDKEELIKEISKLKQILAISNNYEDNSSIDRSSAIDDIVLNSEYSDLISNFGIHALHTRLIGFSEDKTVAIWQISHLNEKLTSNKPYLYRLMNPST